MAATLRAENEKLKANAVEKEKEHVEKDPVFATHLGTEYCH
jgi:hypothetical protein